MNDVFPDERPQRGDFFPRARMRRVDGGIKARSARGAIGSSWWSKRFLAVLEALALGSRLTRGKHYARAGHVLSLEVGPGAVVASVQGSRVKPYGVRIGLAPFAEPVWQAVEAALAAQALFSAQLLAGELPAEIEDVFRRARAPLFPTAVTDLAMSCNCPDHAVPCKHLAATFYLLAEAFDDDPFQILHWRGRPRAVLLERLRELRSDVGEPDAEEDDRAPRGDERSRRSGAVRGKAATDKAATDRAPANRAAAKAATDRAPANRAAAKAATDRAPATKAANTAATDRAAATKAAANAAVQDLAAQAEPAAVGSALALGELRSAPLADAWAGADPAKPIGAGPGVAVERFWLSPVPLTGKPAPVLATEPDLLLRQLATPGPGLGGAALIDALRLLYKRFG